MCRNPFPSHRFCLLISASLSLLLGVLPSEARAKDLPPRAPFAQMGPFHLSSESGDWTLSPGLAVQLRLQTDSPLMLRGQRGPAQPDATTELLARRVRPTVRGNVITRELTYYIHLSTTPGSLELMDVLVDYRFSDTFQARLGQWKIPFTQFRINSFKNLTFTDWPLTTRYFGAERQMGLALHNGYERPPLLEYEVGLFSGVNARAAHAVGLSQLFGKAPPNPSNLVDPDPLRGPHPELVAHLAYNQPQLFPRTDTDMRGGALRMSMGLSVAWDLDPDPVQDLSLRVAPEVLAKLHGLSARGILYMGFAEHGGGADSMELALLGGLVQASYVIQRRLEVAARYARVSVRPGLRQGILGRMQQELEPAAGRDDPENLHFIGTLEGEEEAGLALNAYLVGSAVKWQTDVSWVHRIRAGGDDHGLRFRTQLQLAF